MLNNFYSIVTDFKKHSITNWNFKLPSFYFLKNNISNKYNFLLNSAKIHSNYHFNKICRKIRRLVENDGLNYWVGYYDMELDGAWNLLDGNMYDAGDIYQSSLYYWVPGQPNNSGRCAFVGMAADQSWGLLDLACENIKFGDKAMIGLCEICVD